MSHSEAHSPYREDMHANAAPPSKYREVQQIKIYDSKRASKFRVVLTHVSGVDEEFTITEKAKASTVICAT